MNIKIKKKLGVGVNGTVYLVNYGDTPSIMKIEKYDNDVTTKSTYIREVIFAKDVCNKHPDNFMQLKYYGVMENCDHTQPIPKWVDNNTKKKIINKNKLHRCSVLIYSPVMYYTWKDRPRMSKKQYYTAVKQLVKSVDIMHTNGYSHADIHSKNVMYDGSWKIIDYGSVKHKLFLANSSDKSSDNDMLMLLWTISNNKFFSDYVEVKFIKLPPYKTFINRIMNDDRYQIIKKYIPKTKNIGIKNSCIALTCVILYYDLYVESLGYDYNKFKKYDIGQVDNDLLLYMIKHCMDKDYKLILNYINTLI